MYDNNIVIIGSGLGGLCCGAILAKNGYKVTILEQGTQAGGCLQCFTRHGVKFETGMHFIGSASPGQTLDRMFRYLEVSDHITLSPLSPEAYDVIFLGGERFEFANGRERFIDKMSSYFPKERDNLVHYFDLVEEVAHASTLHSLRHAESDAALNTRYQLMALDEVLESVTTDRMLANVLVGNLPLYGARRHRTPFATQAFITDFYNQSSYRLAGGSDTLSHALIATIERYGGEVRTRSKATKILCDDSHATAVEVNHSQILPTGYVISDAHPIRTLELLDTHLLRPAFRQRINAMPQGIGCFTVYLHFRDDSVEYMSNNFYAYSGDSPWGCEDYDAETWPKGYLYMHMCHEAGTRYAKSAVILSYMHYDEVRRWAGTRPGRRGADYEEMKRAKAEHLLDALEVQFPGTRKNILHYHTSTPLTYLDYTGTANGSMYGVEKDITLGAACRVPHRTRIPNVYLTGQNINSHGALGVLVGSIVTCSEFVPAAAILNQIMESNR